MKRKWDKFDCGFFMVIIIGITMAVAGNALSGQQQRVQSAQEKSTKMTPYEQEILEEMTRIRRALEKISFNY
jgi:nucleoid-associated protein YgaU